MPDPERQRLVRVDERRAMLAFRTWRFLFETAETPRVLAIASGYTAGELRPEAPDPYGDQSTPPPLSEERFSQTVLKPARKQYRA